MEPLWVVLVNPSRRYQHMVDLTKVEQRREEAIQRAILTDDWKKVDN